MTTVGDIISQIEQFAPPHLAEDWDPIGLIFGTKDQRVSKVMVALDLDQDTLQEAIDQEIDLIVTHHPPIFNKLQTLNGEDPRRQQYIDLIKHDIALYAAHTNLDAATGGVNEWLADAIEMSSNREIVTVTRQEVQYQLTVFVPEAEKQTVVEAILEHITFSEHYTDVYYESSGTGHFTPTAGADPAIGTVGEAEQTAESRLEFLVNESELSTVLQALRGAHPYEEPVYNVVQLQSNGQAYGYGRVGTVGKSTPELAQHIMKTFDVSGVRYGTHDETRVHERVAIFGGAGSSSFEAAKQKGATLYITGDISYHTAQDMMRAGLDFIDMGHYTEHIIVPRLVEKLKTFSQEQNWSIKIHEATSQSDMFQYISKQ
ncbi:Nif3-like dinuclear metal center hexameric protein [Dolosigranulum pigrum]|uniref:Nif3-like dinuclear metal center hexameric protein n=1 Tax=Dolosigranulum pigrum TaxID=29394 RepID=UPI001AD8977C|nr:Nif3-like dinuclear metal center hexameric protein [Dolosigranulum pigrum]QTJ56291.1 Nif3-like dinuclear metal center hexameric protein [Dolosigranulum pigrum]